MNAVTQPSATLENLRVDPTSKIGKVILDLEADVEQLRAALRRADRLCREALPQFNWGASALRADAIRLLNEVPGEIRAALTASEG
jgi:hypothetical protein